MYGSDASAMRAPGEGGLYQVPAQLAGFLVHLAGRGVRTVLDVGTFNGWTTTLLAAYLARFGPAQVVSIDRFECLDPAVMRLWETGAVPVAYLRFDDVAQLEDVLAGRRYDLAFIDGNHAYNWVRSDLIRYLPHARMVAFHDINDCFCPDVVRLWAELRAATAGLGELHEFTRQPERLRLMGIGLFEPCDPMQALTAFLASASPGPQWAEATR
jgi:hypothetical protein